MKKIIKLLLILSIFMSLFVGCSNEYERNTEQGIVNSVRLDEALTLANEEEGESIILFVLETCPDCTIMKDILIPYLDTHYLEINEVNLSLEGSSEEEIQRNRDKINSKFVDFNSVPSMYYVKDGEVIDEIKYITEEEQLEEWVVNNKLDKK